MKLFLIFLSFGLLALSACSSHPVIPKKDDIKVSREAAGSACESLGFVEGRTSKVNGKIEDALEDLKEEAVRKGANYVQIETMGALASSIRGQAYLCK